MRGMQPSLPLEKRGCLPYAIPKADNSLTIRVKRRISASHVIGSGLNLNTKLDITRLSGHDGSSGPMGVDPAAPVSSVATICPLVMRPSKGNRGRALSAEAGPETSPLSHMDP